MEAPCADRHMEPPCATHDTESNSLGIPVALLYCAGDEII